jgi:hypothetical protein
MGGCVVNHKKKRKNSNPIAHIILVWHKLVDFIGQQEPKKVFELISLILAVYCSFISND